MIENFVVFKLGYICDNNGDFYRILEILNLLGERTNLHEDHYGATSWLEDLIQRAQVSVRDDYVIMSVYNWKVS